MGLIEGAGVRWQRKERALSGGGGGRIFARGFPPVFQVRAALLGDGSEEQFGVLMRSCVTGRKRLWEVAWLKPVSHGSHYYGCAL